MSAAELAVLPDVDPVAAIAKLGEEGNVTALRQVADEFDAQRLYLKRNGLLTEAQRITKLVILAESELGRLALADELDGVGEHPNVISRWKILYIGRMRGALDSAVRDVFDTGQWSSWSVSRELTRRGMVRVPGGCLRNAYKGSGLTQREIAERANVHRETVGRLVTIGRHAVHFESARRVAVVLGVEPSTLSTCRKGRSMRAADPHRWLHKRVALTGGQWDRAYVSFRVALSEFAKVAGEGQEWDEAYAHLWAIETILQQQMKMKAYGK